MYSLSHPFNRAPIRVLRQGHQSYQKQGYVTGDGQRKFYSRGEKGKLESQPPCDASIQHKSETKNTRPFKFIRSPKRSAICKNTFQGDQRKFSSGKKVKVKNWEKVTNDSTIPSIVKGYITGSERNAGEGCHKGSYSLRGPVSQPSVPSFKEGWRATTIDQPEGLEHIHTLQTFQDGRAPSIKRNFETRWLSMRVGPQRCLFLCSIERTVKIICTFRMGGFPVHTFVCVFDSDQPPTLFTELVNMPNSVLRKLYIGMLVCLDNFLILGKTLEETTLSRETVNLGFVTNLKKSVLHPT